jgi:hypothetical protein
MKIIFLFLLLGSTFQGFSQSDFEIKTSENDRLIKTLNSAVQIAEHRENYLSVKVFILDNGPGSGNSPSCEVSHNVLIAVSEFETAPRQNAFDIGPFINPEFISWSEISEYNKSFEMEYGDFDERKKIVLNVDIKNLKIK